MKKGSVLITDDVHEILVPGLEQLGYRCDYRPEISLDETRVIVKNYAGLVINSKIRVDREMLESAPGLRFVARLGSGLDIIDLPAAAARGVQVLSAPEGNCNAVGEHALGMLLCLANKLLRADSEVRKKIWHREANRGFELEGKTVGIIGFGHTGPAFADKLQGFNVRILVCDPYIQKIPAKYKYVSSATLSELVKRSDIISFHVSLTTETQYLLNDEMIARTKEGVIFINTSRGKVVDTAALIRGLSTGKVGGACLDVFENEKPESFDSEEDALYGQLYKMDNTVLSPHVAGWTFESKRKISESLLEKVRKL